MEFLQPVFTVLFILFFLFVWGVIIFGLITNAKVYRSIAKNLDLKDLPKMAGNNDQMHDMMHRQAMDMHNQAVNMHNQIHHQAVDLHNQTVDSFNHMNHFM